MTLVWVFRLRQCGAVMGGAVWRQLAATSPVYILQLCYGMSGGYPAVTTPQVALLSVQYYLPPLRPQLTMDCALFPITADEESWIVAMDSLVSPLVCLCSGFLQTRFGPRQILRLTCLPYLLAWLCSGLAGLYKSLELLYLSR